MKDRYILSGLNRSTNRYISRTYTLLRDVRFAIKVNELKAVDLMVYDTINGKLEQRTVKAAK